MASMIDACVVNMEQSLRHVATNVNTPCSEFRATLRSMETMGDRLKKARIDAGFKKSAAQAAKACDWPVQTYRSHEAAGKNQSNSRDYDSETAQKYARRFRVDYLWLLYGGRPRTKGAEHVDGRMQRISELDEETWLIIDRLIEIVVAAQKNPR